MRRRVSVALGCALGLLLAVGCHEPDQIRQVEATAVFDTHELDFGDVPVGEWRELAVQVQNVGYVPFHVKEVLPIEENESFVLELDGPAQIPPGESHPVIVRFHPLREGPLETRFNIAVDAENRPEGRVLAWGNGSPTRIEVEPRAIDFETLEIDSDRTLAVRVTNPVDLPLTLTLADNDEGAFSSDTLTIPPHGTVAVPARYFPRTLGTDSGRIEVRSCDDCTPTVVELTGRSVKHAFRFEPDPVAFAAIPVHQRTESHTEVTNITWRPVTVESLDTSDPAFAALTDLSGETLGPDESVRLDMSFAARTAGPVMGLLDVGYTSDRAREADVVLDARGGRPALALAPVTIELGDLPVGAKTGRTVRMTNAGTEGDLHIHGVSASGDTSEFEVTPLHRGDEEYAWSGGTWPALTAPDVALSPGSDYLNLRVLFEPTRAGDFELTLEVHSDDQFHPTRTVTVTGSAHEVPPCEFSARPEVLDFGNVQVGRGAVLGFYFQNTGDADCGVKEIHLADDAGGAFFMPGGPILGGVVGPGEAFSAQIAFRSEESGSFHGALHLGVSGVGDPVHVIPLVGNAMDTCLAAAPPYVDFGPSRYDCPIRPMMSYVSNQCDHPVTVDDAWIGDGTSDQYRIASMPTLPLTLAPSEGFEVGVEYARDVHGQHYSPLFFQAAGEPYPLLVPLLAESNHEGLMSDRFIQGADRLLDVLFVVSNTTTMGPYQDRLAAEVPGWIDAARAAGVELNVGVTSTGLVARDRCTAGARGGEAGRLIPVDGSRARIVTSGRDDAVSALQSNLDVGVCHDLVQGLETMRSALSSPLVDSADDPRTVEPDDGNLGFLRPAARLSVVVLADEDDKSGFGPDAYAQLIDSIKGPNMSHRTELHAIVPTDPSCDSAGPPGARFSGVAEQTGGEVLDVCGGDYAGLLDQIMGSAAGPQRSFQLTDSPVEDEPIEVRVDGETVSGWSYDEEANAIVFEEGAIPAAGETVEVRYRSTC